MTTDDPAAELTRREHDRHTRARGLLEAMRTRAERVASVAADDAASTTSSVDAKIISAHLDHRAASFVDHPDGLFFGAITSGPSTAAEQWYIGRRHIEDENGEPVVIDWRTPVAAPFYRATIVNPFDLRTRLRHSIEDHRVVAVFAEDFDDPDSVGGGGVPDPLLASLERGRSGQMRDIVATIQAEQDEVIRAPLGEQLIVQGGPGTGKTAVGLHRAAFLLFEHREELSRDGVLVVGPNQLFLHYISQVLPSLGETAVAQRTIASLVSPTVRPKAVDADEVAALKGDERMIDLMARLADDAIGTDSDVEAPVGRFVVRFSADDVAAVIKDVRATTSARNIGRTGFQRRMASLWVERRLDRHPAERPEADRLRTQLLGDRQLTAALDKVWPSQSAPALLRRLYANRRVRDRLCGASGVSDGDLLARSAPKRSADEAWTVADLILLDELEHQLNGTRQTFGHVVVDEAQDLSAMGLRSIARRCPGGSMTVLGDLAQATAPASQTSWEVARRHLSGNTIHASPGRTVELEIGYRLPAAILDAAAPLLAQAAPGLRASRSVRSGGTPPSFTNAAADEISARAADVAIGLSQAHGKVGVITTPTIHDETIEQLRRAAADGTGDPVDIGVGTTGIDHPVAVIPHTDVKGLEFDAVVLLEPADYVVDDSPDDRRGLRLLYVAMTRAVHELVIVESRSSPVSPAS